MSGAKDAFVNLRQSEYNRLMKSSRRVDDLENRVRARHNELGRELRAHVDRRARELKERNAANALRIARLNDDLRAFEHQTDARLREQAESFRAGLSELDNRLDLRLCGLSERVEEGFTAIDARLDEQRGEYLGLIAEQSRVFADQLQAQRIDLVARIGAVQASIRKRQGDERRVAASWIADTRALLDLVATHRCEKFAFGQLDALRARLAIAEGNVRQGLFQAAIAAAQQLYVDATKLRVELLQLEEEYEAYLHAARLGADEVLALAEAQATCRFLLETTDGPTEVEGRVDYWTGGALGELLEDARRERTSLAESDAARPDRPHGFTTDDLKDAISRSDRRRKACLQLVQRAREALLASQVRWQMGGVIAEALRAAGFEVVDETYQGEDHRGAFHVKLSNLEGDEIVSVISPEQDDAGGIRNHLNVSFFDKSQNDERLRVKRLDTIVRSLAAQGLDATHPTCPPGTENASSGDPEKLDLRAVARTPVSVKPTRTE